MVKAVIFDMDGVLIDSVHIALKIRQTLLAGYGVDLDSVPDPQGENHRAASLKSLLSSVQSHTGIHINQDEFAKLSTESMRKELQRHSVDPKLVAFLQQLKQHNITCAIATSGRREVVEIKLEILGIGSYFSVVVTGDDVHDHKPNPAAYLYTMEKLGLSAEECIVIEDSMTGVTAGVADGCKVIGFIGYNPSEEPLQDVGLTIQKWSDINVYTIAQL